MISTIVYEVFSINSERSASYYLFTPVDITVGKRLKFELLLQYTL